VLVDHLEGTIEALDPGVAVVERLDGREPARVDRAPLRVDVVPPVRIARPRMALVEDVEIEEPPPVHEPAPNVDMGAPPVLALHDGGAVAEVARVPVPLGVGRRAIGVEVQVAPFARPDGAAPLLEVAAPAVPLEIKRAAVRKDVQPSGRVPHGGSCCGSP
jgi:hypothetical protein